MMQVITWDEVKRHSREDDLWMVLHGRVYDVTAIAKAHPGGVEVLMPFAGADATGPFEEVGHSQESRKWCARYELGVIEDQQENARGILLGATAQQGAAQQKAGGAVLETGLGAGTSRANAAALIVVIVILLAFLIHASRQ